MSKETAHFEAAIMPVLARHFPSALNHDIKVEALRIALAVVLDGKAEFSQEWHRTMVDEQASLNRLSSLMNEARNLLEGLHSFSRGQLARVRAGYESDAPVPKNRDQLLENISDEIRVLEREFQMAQKMVRSQGPWTSRTKGRPRIDVAVMVAWMTGITFSYLAEARPTIINDPITNDARGPFLELVSDVFQAIGIENSPQASAKRAATAIRDKKHPINGGYSPFPM